VLPEVYSDISEIPEAGRLLCLLLSLGSERAAALDGIDEAQWDEVVRLAGNYQLASVLYHRLKHSKALTTLPESVRSVLSEMHLSNDATAMALQYRLGQVLRVFAQRGLPVIVLKGAFLAQVVYPHDSERMMSDVDLLVPKAKAREAVDVLQSLGYQSELGYPVQDMFSVKHEAPVFVKDGFPPIDLHWTLTAPEMPFEIDLDGLWQRAQQINIAGVPVLGLSWEDFLLHLIIHIIRHRMYEMLRSVYDVAAMLHCCSLKIDWEALVLRARTWKVEHGTSLILNLANNLFGASIPESVFDGLQPDKIDPAILQGAYKRLFFQKPTLKYLPWYLVDLFKTNGIREKVFLIVRRFFPPVTEISLHYKVSPRSWRVWFYYPVRWRDLFARWLEPTMKFWRGDPGTQALAQATEKEEYFYLWLMEE
jgi:hypothetical protein